MKVQKILLVFGFVLGVFVFTLGNPTKADAAVTFRAAASGSTGSGCTTTSWTINVPTGTVNGDVMIASIQFGNTTLTPPAGWTSLDSVSNTGLTANLKTYYRVASSEPASYTWTLAAAVCNVGTITTYTGANGTPAAVSSVADNVSQTTHVANNVTTTVANAAIVTIFAGYDTTCGTGSTWTAPTGQTQRINANNSSCRSMGVNDSVQASPGISGYFTGTINTAGTALMTSTILNPLAVAPTLSTSASTSTIAVGPFNPTTVWSDNYDAYSKPWTTPSNAMAADGLYTTSILDGTLTGRYTSLLWGYGFGFNIPTGVSILGITADVKSSVSSGTDSWYTFLSTCANLTQGSGGGCLGGGVGKYIAINTTMQYGSAGSASDLWGVAWTPANINSSTFGMRVQESNIVSSGSFTYSVDHYRMTVTIQSVSGITASGATLVGYVASDGGSAVTARGVCVGTSANPSVGGTCFTSAGTTGGFTVSATGLAANTLYHFRSYATNAIGTSYGTDDTFTTLNNLPTLTTTAATTVDTTSVTLNGTANPLSIGAVTGYFRYAAGATLACDDVTGTRFPSSGGAAVANGTGAVAFSQNLTGISAGTQYAFCAYGSNANGVGKAPSSQTFTTPTNTAGCVPPVSGSLSVSSSCYFSNQYDGVDAGGSTATTIGNTGVLTIPAGKTLTVGPGAVPNQKIAYGSISKPGAVIVKFAGSSLVRGGVWAPDADGDGVPDSANPTYVVSATQPVGYSRRSFVGATNISVADCAPYNPYAYRTVTNLVKDADQDGYKTAAAASSQCVGASSVVNGRTYYNDGSGPN